MTDTQAALTIGQLAQRVGLIEVAKRAGFTLDEVRVLLQSADAGTPAFASLRELANRKLPEVEALITRAQAMRDWLLTATDCSCNSLDVCALFKPPPHPGRNADLLSSTHVDPAEATAQPSGRCSTAAIVWCSGSRSRGSCNRSPAVPVTT